MRRNQTLNTVAVRLRCSTPKVGETNPFMSNKIVVILDMIQEQNTCCLEFCRMISHSNEEIKCIYKDINILKRCNIINTARTDIYSIKTTA